MGRIVVGVDGSPGSVAALRWAAAEARLRGDSLDVIAAWDFPMTAAVPGLAVPLEPFGEQGADALRELEKTVADAGLQVGDDNRTPDGLEVIRRVEMGAPSAVLIEASRDADLLVVGARGHGGFLGLVLGSVSHQVAGHADCPVVIVRPERK